MSRHVRHKIILLARSAPEHLPQLGRLHEILVGDGELQRDRGAGPLLVFLRRFHRLVGQVPVRRRVVWVGTVIAVDGHHAITLIRVEGPKGLIDRDLLVIHPETMAVGVRVGKEAGLQHRIGRRFHPRDHVRRGKCDLLDLGEVIFGVAVEDELAKRPERDFALRPHLGQVEDVPMEFLGFVGAQHLHVTGPRRMVAFFDRAEQIFCVPVRIFGPHLGRLFIVEGLAALVGLAVDLNVVEGPVGFRKLISMSRVSIHVTVGVRSATIGEQVHDLMSRLLMGRQIVPEHGGIFEIRLGVSLLCVDENGEFGGVAKEEDRGVVEDPVPIAFIGVEFERKASWIPGRIRRPLFAADGGEASDTFGFLADCIEHIQRGRLTVSISLHHGWSIFVSHQITDIMCHLKLSIRSGPFGVHHPLRDSFTIKMGEEIDQMKVLQQQRPVLAQALSGFWIHDGTAIGGRIHGSFLVSKSTEFYIGGHCEAGRWRLEDGGGSNKNGNRASADQNELRGGN